MIVHLDKVPMERKKMEIGFTQYHIVAKPIHWHRRDIQTIFDRWRRSSLPWLLLRVLPIWWTSSRNFSWSKCAIHASSGANNVAP